MDCCTAAELGFLSDFFFYEKERKSEKKKSKCAAVKSKKFAFMMGCFSGHTLNTHTHTKIKISAPEFSAPTCWRVSEGCGIMPQLLPPAVSTVQPATEAHQRQPGGHPQSCDEGRLLHHACDLLRYAQVTACLHSRRSLV